MILLAVVLFAALAATVTSALRGGGKDAGSDKYDLMAQRILQYGSLVQNTANRMMLSGNVKDWEFDFNDGTGPSTHGGNGACTFQVCRMFNNAGTPGQMDSLKFEEAYVDPAFRTSNPTYGGGSGTATNIMVLQITDVGTSLPELVMVIQGLRTEICAAINRLAFQGSVTNEGYGSGFGSYVGTLSSFPSATKIWWNYPRQEAACIGRSAPYSNYGGDFYQVLLVR